MFEQSEMRELSRAEHFHYRDTTMIEMNMTATNIASVR